MRDDRLTVNQHRSIALYLQKDYKGWNKSDVAKEMNLSERTLRRWRQDKTYMDELNKQAKELNRMFLPTAYAELRRIILEDNVEDRDKLKAIRIYLNMYGLLQNNVETETTLGVINVDISELYVR